MSFDIPSIEERHAARAKGTLKQWVDPINHEILNGDWKEDNSRFDYLHVATDGRWIEETYWHELRKAYDDQFWILEQHSDHDEKHYWIQVYRKKKPEA